MPSATPSLQPSTHPSDVPSSKPSASPSSMPSSSPTLTCHDKVAYKSPINGLTCADHSGTDCYQWRNIGLNTTELGDLINNCPETCNIPCGAFVDFSILVSYRLTGIPGLLDGLSKVSLEKASFDYILQYFEDAAHEHIFELDMVELSSQSLVTPERKLRRQTQKVTQSGLNEIVVVTVVFDGFSIGMTYNEISDLLVSGMNSTGFTQALQASDEFFETAVISSAETKEETVHEPDEDERNGPSSATVLIIILLVIGFGTALSFALFHREKLKAWCSQEKLREAPSNTDSDSMPSSQQGRPRFISIDMTPRVVSESTFHRNSFHRYVDKVKGYLAEFMSSRGIEVKIAYPGSPIQNSESQSSCLSHQGSPVNVASILSFGNSTNNANNASTTTNNGVRRLNTGITTSRSKSSTEADGSSISSGRREKVMGPLDTISPMSEVTEESVEPEHQLSNVIPPMIVIDYIDDTPCKGKQKKAESKMVPGKLVQASALKGPSSIPTLVLDFPELNAWRNHDEIPHALSPLGITVDSDSDSEDDTSCASTPVHTTTQKLELSQSRSLSGTALDKLNSMKSPLHLLTLQPSSSYAEDDIGCPLDSDGEVSIELVFYRSKSLRNQVSPIEEPSGHQRVGLINSIWAMSPSAIRGTPKSSKKSPGAKKSLLTRRSSNNSTLEGPADRNAEYGTPKSSKKSPGAKKSLLTGRSSNNATLEGPADRNAEYGAFTIPKPDSTKLTFEAPRTGQLGLVIEARNNSGPFVHAVKDYSPLFGAIMKGDKIFEIDGKNQTGNTLSDVMHLLASKSGRRQSNSQNLKIVVERYPNALSEPAHESDNSCGSSSVEGSNRIIGDVDSFGDSGYASKAAHKT
jgi:hypothetical protein